MIPIWFREITAPTTEWVEAFPNSAEYRVVRRSGEVFAILVQIYVYGELIGMKAFFDANSLRRIQRANPWVTGRFAVREFVPLAENLRQELDA